MRKEILVTNYNPKKLKQLREMSNISFEMLEGYETIDTDNLVKLENSQHPLPIDIFYLAYLYVTYKNIADQNGIKKFPSLTSDLMNPHPKGLEYQEFIINHENYKGMPVKRKNNGQVKWVSTIKTQVGQERIQFWERKRLEFGIRAESILDSGVRKKVAFANHPNKKHVCLFSGTELYIDYRYLSPSKLNQINNAYGRDLRYYDLDIFETCDVLFL